MEEMEGLKNLEKHRQTSIEPASNQHRTSIEPASNQLKKT